MVLIYLLCIVEVGSIYHVFDLRWLNIFLKSAEVIFTKLGLSMSLETLVQRRHLPLVVFRIDCLSSSLGE